MIDFDLPEDDITDAEIDASLGIKGKRGPVFKTHCKNGHELTPENISVKSGRRVCKICRYAQNKKYLDRVSKTSEFKEWRKAYNAERNKNLSPEKKERKREVARLYKQKPEQKSYNRQYEKQYRARKSQQSAAEIELLKEDAARYRWLRDRAWYVDAATYALELRERWRMGDDPPPDSDDVERALDDARKRANE